MLVSPYRLVLIIMVSLAAAPPAMAASDGGKPVAPFTLEDTLCRANTMIADHWKELDRQYGMSYQNGLTPGQTLVTTQPTKVTGGTLALPVGTRVVIVERLSDGMDYRVTAPDLAADRVLAVTSDAFYPTIAQQIEHRDRIADLRNQFLAELDVVLLRDHGLSYDALSNMKIVPRNGILCLSDPQ